MKALVLVTLTAGLVCGVPSLAQDAKKDVEQLRGRWWAVGAFDADGKVTEIGQDDSRYFTFVFDAHKLTTHLKKRTVDGTYKVDPSKNPKEIDIVRRRGDEELTSKGIYAVEGDRLKVCLAGAGNERPRGFKSGKGIEFAVELKQLKPGQTALSFTAETTDGKKIALAEYRGKSAVLLVFCANYREGCHEAFPHVKKIDEKYRTKGIQVIAVPLEEERDGAALLGKEFKVEFPTIFDPKYKIADGYGVDRGGGGTPYCVLICRDGKVVVNGDIDITREGAVISWVEGTQVKFVPLEKAVKELAETK